MLIPVAVDWEDWPKQLADSGARLPERMLEWTAEYDRNVDVCECRGLINIQRWDGEVDPDDPYGLAPFVERVMDDPTIDQQAAHEFEEGVRT